LHYGKEWVYLALDQPVVTVPGAALISTKLDADSSCRIMFSGAVVRVFKQQHAEEQKQLRVIKARSYDL
jgi:hypothetical protein